MRFRAFFNVSGGFIEALGCFTDSQMSNRGPQGRGIPNRFKVFQVVSKQIASYLGSQVPGDLQGVPGDFRGILMRFRSF